MHRSRRFTLALSLPGGSGPSGGGQCSRLERSGLLSRDQVGMALQKDNESLRVAVNKALSELIRDGTLETLCKKYFSGYTRCVY